MVSLDVSAIDIDSSPRVHSQSILPRECAKYNKTHRPVDQVVGAVPSHVFSRLPERQCRRKADLSRAGVRMRHLVVAGLNPQGALVFPAWIPQAKAYATKSKTS
jgi:hypothetical protein